MSDPKSSQAPLRPSKPGWVEVPEFVPPRGPPSAVFPGQGKQRNKRHVPEFVPPQGPPLPSSIGPTHEQLSAGTSATGGASGPPTTERGGATVLRHVPRSPTAASAPGSVRTTADIPEAFLVEDDPDDGGFVNDDDDNNGDGANGPNGEGAGNNHAVEATPVKEVKVCGVTLTPRTGLILAAVGLAAIVLAVVVGVLSGTGALGGESGRGGGTNEAGAVSPIENADESLLPTFAPTKDSVSPTPVSVVPPIASAQDGDTSTPSAFPTREPTPWPTIKRTNEPTRMPTEQPASQPTRKQTEKPSSQPVKKPTIPPTEKPTRMPTPLPTPQPTERCGPVEIPAYHKTRGTTTCGFDLCKDAGWGQVNAYTLNPGFWFIQEETMGLLVEKRGSENVIEAIWSDCKKCTIAGVYDVTRPTKVSVRTHAKSPGCFGCTGFTDAKVEAQCERIPGYPSVFCEDVSCSGSIVRGEWNV